MVYKKRRLVSLLIVFLLALGGGIYEASIKDTQQGTVESSVTETAGSPASEALAKLEIKGKAPKTGYTRAQFSEGWADAPGCNVRNYILKRDLTSVETKSPTDCTVIRGVLKDPYTDKTLIFVNTNASAVQIDHVVALSNAWQTGAQQITPEQRYSLANDALNLLAVDGPANGQKSDADAATWLPPNKDYRCRYVARQIAVKQKYTLWVTQAERDAMQKILNDCPGQVLPVVAVN